MRPRGEIRAALSEAAHRLAPTAPTGLTYADLAVASRVGFELARMTVKNMVKAGELRPVGKRSVPGSKRPQGAYLPVQRTQHCPAQSLAGAMRGWVNGY